MSREDPITQASRALSARRWATAAKFLTTVEDLKLLGYDKKRELWSAAIGKGNTTKGFDWLISQGVEWDADIGRGLLIVNVLPKSALALADWIIARGINAVLDPQEMVAAVVRRPDIKGLQWLTAHQFPLDHHSSRLAPSLKLTVSQQGLSAGPYVNYLISQGIECRPRTALSPLLKSTEETSLGVLARSLSAVTHITYSPVEIASHRDCFAYLWDKLVAVGADPTEPSGMHRQTPAKIMEESEHAGWFTAWVREKSTLNSSAFLPPSKSRLRP